LEEKITYGRGLTLRVWILTFIMAAIQITTTQLNHTMTNVWMFPSGILPLAPVLIIFFFHNILPSKWKFSREELTILIVISFLNANAFYLVGGYISPYGGIQLLPGQSPVSAAYIKSTSPYKDVFAAFIPDWMAPSSNLNVVINGGILDWGAWIPSIAFWSLLWITFILFGTFISFSLRKPFVIRDRLSFPMSMCTYPLLDYQIEKDGGKRVKILNFSRPEAKAFWIGGAIGAILGLTDILNYFLPAIPASWEYAGNHIDLTGVFQQYLPGAYGNTWLWWMDVPIYAFAPLEITLTCVISYIVILIIYPAFIVRLGVVSYVPGVEETADVQYGLVEGPFKFIYWRDYGLMFGIGLWVAWHYRKHFVNIFRNITAQTSEPMEDDISYRFIGLGMIILWILLLIFWTIAGVPPFVAFVGLILLVIYILANCRVCADTYIDDTQLGAVRGFLYDVGYATGLWGSAPYVNEAIFKTMYMSSMFSGISWSGFYPQMQSHIWKIGYETKTNTKDILKVIIVIAIFSVIFSIIFGLWWWSKCGGVTASPGWPAYSDRAADAELYTLTSGHTLTALERVWYALTGVIFVFVCFYLRGKFRWFIIHPAGVWTALASPMCHLWPPLIGFIYKLVILRVGGTRLWERVGIPFMLGFIALQTLGMFFVLAWYGFFSQALPAALSYL
jgi:hypothetical protein